MCTAITLHSPHGWIYFGRTMDFSYPLAPEIYRIPKGYLWTNLPGTHQIRNLYNIIGIGQNIDPMILADGVNEMGFAAAVLYFPGYAKYDPIPPKGTPKICIAALELVNFLLGQCASVAQAATLLRAIRIVGMEDSVTGSVAPLHWMLTDKSGKCMTVEKTDSGLQLMDNDIGVLSNSPDFTWHMTNLRNYMNVSSRQNPEEAWNNVTLTPFGQGAGTFGLPGDYSPPSRFVRTAWLKSHTPIPADNNGAVNTGFHILESVSIPKGAVITSRGTPDYTQYTAIIDVTCQEYFFKTYDNSAITSVKLAPEMLHGNEIISSPIAEHPKVRL